MGKAQKYYVVWQGNTPGIYDSWEDCLLQVKGYPNAKYKAFNSLALAKEAYGNVWTEVTKKTAGKKFLVEANTQIIKGSLAVDAACSGNPGDMEYRGVDIDSGTELFHFGPVEMGTNNIGEFLAIVHALALLQKEQKPNTTIYTDSRTAISWVKRKHANTKLVQNAKTKKLHELIIRAESWLKNNTYQNPIVKWETESLGEIPADFGRK